MVTEGGTELLDGGRWLQTASLLTGVDLNISAIVTDGTMDLAQPTYATEHLTALKGRPSIGMALRESCLRANDRI